MTLTLKKATAARRTKSALLCALALPAALALSPVAAKTLVYCSEGSPENFYPGVNTTGTSFDVNRIGPPGPDGCTSMSTSGHIFSISPR